eukprot:CAMPEP_0178444138 /NCGR_PEP_ID=MMETSP0689_2-20121128/39320_1 /TAXON_ID=160604 /ORGANISM="Amphidinium massartii, Strain CS-259" /LENGTH=337 /DNA_ID=CAMNT_0020068295 /DNA_START=64 /DNA_END=1074 /DNA_ORIENTATION=-
MTSSSDDAWKQSLEEGSHVLVQPKAQTDVWVAGVVVGKTYGGGSSWLRLEIEDASRPDGRRRLSLPFMSKQLRQSPDASDENPSGADRDPEATAPTTSSMIVQVCMLSGAGFEVQVPRNCTVAELKDAIAALAGVAAEQQDLALNGEVLSSMSRRPFSETLDDDSLAIPREILLVKRLPSVNVELLANNMEEWEAMLQSVPKAYVHLRAHDGNHPPFVGGEWQRPNFVRLCDVLAAADNVVGFSLSNLRQLPGGVPGMLAQALCKMESLRCLDISRALQGDQEAIRAFLQHLPVSLEDLNISFNWDNEVFLLVQQMEDLRRCLPQALRSLEALQVLR